jgi:hypothetical protein
LTVFPGAPNESMRESRIPHPAQRSAISFSPNSVERRGERKRVAPRDRLQLRDRRGARVERGDLATLPCRGPGEMAEPAAQFQHPAAMRSIRRD